MKKIYIERLMEGIKIPIDIINETIENNMHFPILKMKQKTILDNNSNEENQITDFICSKCSHKFTVIGKVTGYQECPSCKNRDSYFISKTISEITAEFKFSQTLSVNFTKDNDETIGTYKSRFYYNEYKGNRTLDTSEILILNKQIIDGRTFFTLSEHGLFLDCDETTGQRKFFVPFSGNMIIFGLNEIVNIKNWKKSSASFERTYSKQFFENYKLVLSNKNTISKFANFIKNFNVICEENCIIQKGNDKNFYFLDLNLLDSFATYIKETKPMSPATLKRQQFIESIISSLPEAKPFGINDDNVYYNTLEIDEITNLKTIEYVCPHCKGKNIDTKKKYYSYWDNGIERFVCQHCGAIIKEETLCDALSYNNSKKYVSVIHNYDNGIIIYDTVYRCMIKDENKYFVPIEKDKKPKTIIIIKKEFDIKNLMSNIIILRGDGNGSEYSIGKNLKMNFNDGSSYINNVATNFSMQWSGVEKIKDNNRDEYPSIDVIAGFILLYRQYPVLEKIIKEGQNPILFDILKNFNWENGSSTFNYDLSQKDVSSALRISKSCIRILNDEEYKNDKLSNFKNLQLLYTIDNNITAENYKYIVNNNVSPYKITDVCEKFNLSIHQVCEYLERVRINQCVVPSIAMNEWGDYLDGCSVIGSDLNDRRVKYPAALRTEHDKVMYKKQIIDNQEYEEKFKKVTNEYGEKFSKKGKKFIVTYPKKLQDLFEEGRRLNHCVGSYGDSIKNGNSIILFVRKAEEPDIPYFTLEISPRHKAVTQFYGYSDKMPHPKKDAELISFIKDWAKEHNIYYRP